jgi:hypothetical protein
MLDIFDYEIEQRQLTEVAELYLKRFLEQYREALGADYEKVCGKIAFTNVYPGVLYLQLDEEVFIRLQPVTVDLLAKSPLLPAEVMRQWFFENVAKPIERHLNRIINNKQQQIGDWDKSLKQRLRSYSKKSIQEETKDGN